MLSIGEVSWPSHLEIWGRGVQASSKAVAPVFLFSTIQVVHVLMREGRKKEASKIKQTTKQSNMLGVLCCFALFG